MVEVVTFHLRVAFEPPRVVIEAMASSPGGSGTGLAMGSYPFEWVPAVIWLVMGGTFSSSQ